MHVCRAHHGYSTSEVLQSLIEFCLVRNGICYATICCVSPVSSARGFRLRFERPSCIQSTFNQHLRGDVKEAILDGRPEHLEGFINAPKEPRVHTLQARVHLPQRRISVCASRSPYFLPHAILHGIETVSRVVPHSVDDVGHQCFGRQAHASSHLCRHPLSLSLSLSLFFSFSNFAERLKYSASHGYYREYMDLFYINMY